MVIFYFLLQFLLPWTLSDHSQHWRAWSLETLNVLESSAFIIISELNYIILLHYYSVHTFIKYTTHLSTWSFSIIFIIQTSCTYFCPYVPTIWSREQLIFKFEHISASVPSNSFWVFKYFLAVMFATCFPSNNLQHHFSVFLDLRQSAAWLPTAEGEGCSHGGLRDRAHLSSTLPLIRAREMKSFLPFWPL